MKVSWQVFDELIHARGMDMLMVEDSSYYHLAASENGFLIECILDKSATDQSYIDEFELEHKATCNPKRTDNENSPVVRVKYCRLGWKYWNCSMQLETSNLTSFECSAWDGDYDASTLYFYDADGVELTTQNDIDTSCVVTRVDWMPTFDVELLEGTFKQIATPTQPVKLFVRAVPDISTELGGCVDFVTNMDLQFLGAFDAFTSDGRASKEMPYNSGIGTNKIRIELRHPAGFKHKCQISLEFFRA